MTPHELWEYYLEAAKYFFQGVEILDKNGNVISKKKGREPFTPNMYNFFEAQGHTPNDITMAVLGDRSAFDRLRFTRHGEAERMIKEKFPNGLPHWKGSLNPGQMSAVKNALTQPISLIKGPPGTGKTEVILNILTAVAQLNSEHPDNPKTVLVTSINNAAVQNVQDKLEAAKGNAAGSSAAYLVSHFARLGNSTYRNEFSGRINEKVDFPIKYDDELRVRFPFVLCTIHSLKLSVEYDFDYVIIDEASQSNIMFGLAAMMSGKHIIIVGDTDQLPPVGGDPAYKELENEQVPPIYRLAEKPQNVRDGKNEDDADPDPRSFLEMCRSALEALIPNAVFEGKPADGDIAVGSMLDMHYRCDPDIIGFCNKMIYGGKLDLSPVESRRMSIPPIRVLWYEGDYCEMCRREDNKDRKSKKNSKQMLLFLKEELPRLITRLRNGEIDSVCILTPYVGQEAAIQAAAPNDIEATIKNITDAGGSDAQQLVLTIHKSQGKEYDIVYLMPVEDETKQPWPWSQNRNMINVAVSRAKKELRIITSSIIMESGLSAELLGKESDSTENYAFENQRYTRALISYAADSLRTRGLPLTGNGTFGFVRTNYLSIFDEWDDLKRGVGKNKFKQASLCEQIVRSAVENSEAFKSAKQKGIVIRGCLKLVNLTGTEKLTEEQQAFIKAHESAAEFDIALCDKNGRLLLAIEVDGPYHRENEEVKDKDEIKNSIVTALGGAMCSMDSCEIQPDSTFIFLRIPCDGSTYMETRKLRYKLAAEIGIEKAAEIYGGTVTLDEFTEKAAALAAGDNDVYYRPPFWEKQFMNVNRRYIAFLEDVSRRICSGSNEDAKKALEEFLDGHVTFAAGSSEAMYTDEHYREMYFLRYIPAYACNFAQAYMKTKERLDSMDKPPERINILSIGSGCCVDYWGAEQAFGNRPFTYTGVDLAEWDDYGISGGKSNYRFIPGTDIFDYLKTECAGKPSDVSLYVFPKSISDLSSCCDRLFRSIAALRHTQKTIAFLSVYRTNSSYDDNKRVVTVTQEDEENTDLLRAIMEEAGYRFIPELSDDRAAAYSEKDDRVLYPKDLSQKDFAFLKDWYNDRDGGKERIITLTNEIIDSSRSLFAREPVYFAAAARGYEEHYLLGDNAEYFREPVQHIDTRFRLLVFQNPHAQKE